jgi:hypothetical protein
MSYEQFLAGQRKGVNVVFAFFVSLVAFMWVATLVDWAFELDWGWDRQILWLAPLMILFAGLVRFCATAIFQVRRL